MARTAWLSLAWASAAAEHRGLTCAWGERHDARCDSAAYAGPYPTCALYQWPDGKPVPCQGLLPNDACEYKGAHAGSTPPVPASYHVHVLFPNSKCTNCTKEFSFERPLFSYKGAMALRGELAAHLNILTQEILGRPPRTPIDVARAAEEPEYDQCERLFSIGAGQPANYHTEPCIFSVDDDKKPGPFTDPSSGLGYPNWSFLLPGHTWMPKLLDKLSLWLEQVKARPGGVYSEYDILIHPNSGCEVRDHIEEQGIRWLGQGHPLLPDIFHCNALGCNQACPTTATPLKPPANCSWSPAAGERLIV